MLVAASAGEPGSQHPIREPGQKAQDRVAWLDVARALGVLGVILGHACYGGAVERITLSFDLALFFFVSGFVYSEKYSSRPDLLALRRLKTLYLPFVRWELFWLVLHNLLFRFGIYSTQAGYLGQTTPQYTFPDFLSAAFYIVTFRGTEPMAGALWFLESLFVTNIVFGLISFAIVKTFRRGFEPVRAAAVLAVATAGYYSNPLLENRVHIGTSLLAVLFFYWGLIFRQYQGRIPLKWYLALPAALWAIYAGSGVYLGANEYRSPLQLLTAVPAGIYASVALSRLLENNRLLRYIGTNTIFIIATHFLAFKVVSLVRIRVYGEPEYYLAKFPIISGDHGWWIPYFLCGTFLPVGLKYCVDRLWAARGRISWPWFGSTVP